MPSKVDKVTHLAVTTDNLRIEHDSSKREFTLIYAPNIQTEGVTIGEIHIVLREDLVLQMADLIQPSLPEPPDESVH